MPSLSSPLLIAAAAALALLVLLVAVARVPLRYNVRNLTVRWKTTLLTALAFTLVVSLLVVMLAFVGGMYRLTEASGQPGNVIILSDGATDEIFSNLSADDVGDIENQPGIVRIEGRPLASREIYLIVNQPIPGAQPGRPQRRFLQLRGIDDATAAARVHNLNLYPGGTWFSEAGVQAPVGDKAGDPAHTAVQAVIGEGIARQLARDRGPDQRASARNPDRLEAGDTFILGERPWLVVGVMQSAGSTFDSEVWAKRSVIGPLFGKSNYSSVVVRAPDAAGAAQLKDFFTTRYKKSAVQAQVETEYFAGLAGTNQQFLYAIVFVTVVMAIGGVFGVMNTMFAAVSQRIRDIGMLRLLGYARWQILVSLLLESLAIALVGGLLGCMLGSLVDGWTATSIVSSGPGGGKFVVLKLIVDPSILTGGLLVSLAMGAAGGLVPALSAMRLRPLDALR